MSEALPPGWRVQVSRSTGEKYYVNNHTEESTYDVPTGPSYCSTPMQIITNRCHLPIQTTAMCDATQVRRRTDRRRIRLRRQQRRQRLVPLL